MKTFRSALDAFAEGETSLEELLTAIDRKVAEGEDDATVLLAAVAEWSRETPVTASIRERLEERILASAAATIPEQAPRGKPDPAGGEGPSSVPFSPPSQTPTLDFQSGVAAPLSLGVGNVLKGRFRLEEELGAGGMGKVFKALDRIKVDAEDRNPFVAVKVLGESFRQRPDAFKALQRETEKARTLAHPNIIRVYDCDRDGDAIFMTMEYLSGQSLDRVMKSWGKGGRPLAKVLEIMTPVGEALAFAHRAGLVHSDFKPSNVFVTSDNQIKIIDFGIARAVKRPTGDGERTAFDVGALRALSPPYASPEMWQEDHEPDPRDDVFAFACVLYQQLTGEHPFKSIPAPEAKARGLEPARPPGLTTAQWTGLRNALAFDRAKRTATIDQALREIRGRPPVPPLTIAAAGLACAVGVAIVIYVAGRPVTIPQDEVERRLADVPCAILTAAIKGERVVVSGLTGEETDVAAVRAGLLEVNGVGDVAAEIGLVPKTFCDVLSTFAPAVRRNGTANPGLAVTLQKPVGDYVEGESLVVTVDGPAAGGYLYVDLFMPDGYVQHMLPRTRADQHQILPGERIVLSGEAWTVGSDEMGALFGTNLIVATTFPEPTHNPDRWENERAARYLAVLGQALDRPGEKAADGILAHILAFTTRPR